MMLPRLASVVFRAVASDVTLTVSAIWPMPSGTSRRAFMSTWSWTFSRTAALEAAQLHRDRVDAGRQREDLIGPGRIRGRGADRARRLVERGDRHAGERRALFVGDRARHRAVPACAQARGGAAECDETAVRTTPAGPSGAASPDTSLEGCFAGTTQPGRTWSHMRGPELSGM